ncbi:MAG: MauE/DoxX family redox-associated membrane protein [Flavisolibacter sp.]
MKIKQEVWLQLICSLLIFLFAYTAISKLLDLKGFTSTLAHSPLIGATASWVSLGLPLTESSVVCLLCIPATQKWGLLGAFFLMAFFTLYVGYMLLFANSLPCSCGGVLKGMSWKNHLVFNISFTLIAWLGWLLKKNMLIQESQALVG